MSCGKDAVSWWIACWAHRWAQTQRSHFLMPPITFVPGAGSKGSTGEPGDKGSWGTGGRGGTVWVRTNDMAHLRVLDCMVSHKWSRICDLYCAFNSQVCAAFLHLYCSVHEINFSVHVFLKCTVCPVKESHCSADIHSSLFWPWQPSLCLISWKCLSDTKNNLVYSCSVGMQNWLHGALVTDPWCFVDFLFKNAIYFWPVYFPLRWMFLSCALGRVGSMSKKNTWEIWYFHWNIKTANKKAVISVFFSYF